MRSPFRRFVLIVLATLLVSVVTTFQLYELFDEWAQRRFEAVGRRPEFQWFEAFERQLLNWGLWALAAEPMFFVFRLLSRLLSHWLIIVLVHVPLSYGAAYGSVELTRMVAQQIFDPVEQPADRANPGPGGGRRRAPDGEPGRERRRGEQFGEDAGMPGPGGRQGARFGQRPRGPRSFRDFMRSRRFRMQRDMGVYWAILAIWAGMSAYLRSREQERAASRSQLNSANLETRLARAQMDSLKSQLQPHFLFNSLHTVGGLIRAGEDPAALKTLSALGGLLRKTLDLGESQRVTLREEIEIAELYVSIEKIRFADRLRVETTNADEALDYRVPALLLLPLVENCVRYAVEPRVEGGTVKIRTSVVGDRLQIVVEDDGPGFPENVLRGEDPDDGRTHIGIANSRRRLEMLYGDGQVFELSNLEGGGAQVRVELPIEREAEHD